MVLDIVGPMIPFLIYIYFQGQYEHLISTPMPDGNLNYDDLVDETVLVYFLFTDLFCFILSLSVIPYVMLTII